WQSFVERSSIVEKILSADIVYKKMNFATRDMYRHAVERIAAHGAKSEKEVAILAMKQADNYEHEPGNIPEKHVGYFLVGKGVARLEKEARYTYNFWQLCSRIFKKYPTQFYIGIIALTTFLICRWLYLQVDETFAFNWQKFLLALVLATGVSQLMMGLANWV